MLAIAGPAWAQAAAGPPVGPTVLREVVATVLALAAVCVVAFVCLLALKRLQSGGQTDAGAACDLRFVRALPVGARERLIVVRWRGRSLLLGVTAGSISVLDDGGGADPVEGSPPAAADLTRTLLARVFSRRPRENPS